GITAGVRAFWAAFALLAAIVCAWAVVRRTMNWLDAAGWSVLAVLAAIASVVPWYVAWGLPIGALAWGRGLGVAVLALACGRRAAPPASGVPRCGGRAVRPGGSADRHAPAAPFSFHPPPIGPRGSCSQGPPPPAAQGRD